MRDYQGTLKAFMGFVQRRTPCRRVHSITEQLLSMADKQESWQEKQSAIENRLLSGCSSSSMVV